MGVVCGLKGAKNRRVQAGLVNRNHHFDHSDYRILNLIRGGFLIRAVRGGYVTNSLWWSESPATRSLSIHPR